MAKKLTNQQQARLWICRDCDYHKPLEGCGRCERIADVKRVGWLLDFEDAMKPSANTYSTAMRCLYVWQANTATRPKCLPKKRLASRWPKCRSRQCLRLFTRLPLPR